MNFFYLFLIGYFLINFILFIKPLQKQPPLAPVVPPQTISNPLNIVNNTIPVLPVQNHVTKTSPSDSPSLNHQKPVVNEKPPTLNPQTVVPTAIAQAMKPVSLPSPDKPKPNVLSPVPSTYTDPLEQSLASLEHDIIKSENIPPSSLIPIPPILNNAMQPTNTNCNSNLNPPILQPNLLSMDKPPLSLSNLVPTNPLLHPMHPSLDTELPPILQTNSSTTNALHPHNNGFDIKQEFDMRNTNNNGMAMTVPMNMSIPSLFDPLPPVNNQQLIHPKPISELIDPLPMLDKKLTPPELSQKNQSQFDFKIKQEPNVKNACSWSSIASSSPQNTTPGSGSHSRQQAKDSFKAFQKQAKEKADREKQRLESLELKRQKEQAEKERMRVENERRRGREEEELDKAR